MKHKTQWILIAYTLFLGWLLVACEGPDQPTYDRGNPDPNPAGTPSAALDSVSPSEGYFKDTVTVYGHGFNSTPAFNIIAFGGYVGTVLEAESNMLKVLTPSIVDETVNVKVGVKGAEFWSNELEFTFKPVIPEIIDEEILWPNGVAIDADGNVYIGSAIDSAVYKISPDGTKSLFAQVSIHGAIHIGPQNYLYVCSGGGKGLGKVFRISPDGLVVEEVVEVNAATDVDWDSLGNMYIVSGDYGIFMMNTEGNITEVASDIGSVKNCRVFGNYLYVNKIWEGQITRFEIMGNGLGTEEIYLQLDAEPSSFEFDKDGTMYYAKAWETSLYTLNADGTDGAILFEEQLMTPMRYMTIYGKKLYVVYPGWGDVGMTMSVYIGAEQAPYYGRQ